MEQAARDVSGVVEKIDLAGSIVTRFGDGSERAPQSLSLTIINGVALFLVSVAILLAPGEGDFGTFLANFAFYAIFSAVIPTAMTRVMFMSDALQSATDAVNRVEEILAAPVAKAPAAPKEPADNSIVFDDVSFAYEGADEPALSHVSFSVPAGSTVALVGPSGGQQDHGGEPLAPFLGRKRRARAGGRRGCAEHGSA